jgi:hypothetical protein
MNLKKIPDSCAHFSIAHIYFKSATLEQIKHNEITHTVTAVSCRIAVTLTFNVILSAEIVSKVTDNLENVSFLLFVVNVLIVMVAQPSSPDTGECRLIYYDPLS